jgi:hypothetical protein
MSNFMSANGPYLVSKERNDGNGFPVKAHEFNFKAVTFFMSQDYRADVSHFEAMFGQVSCQDNTVKFLYHVCLREG